MKRFTKLLTLSLLSLTAFAIPMFAEELMDTNIIQSPVAIAPKWDEFCETGYEKVTATDKNDIFDIFSFVKSERAKKNYWAARRDSFNKYLSYCSSISNEDDKGVCYSELRKIETDKNDDYKRHRNQMLYQNHIIIDK